MKIDQYSLLKEKLSSNKFSSIFVLVDDNTNKFCLDIFLEKTKIKQFKKIIINPGEQNKNIDTCLIIWDKLNTHKADRKSLIINLGGGVLTDIGGFVASTYLRGINFINVPTTLLGMVDAAHGGKTGIDFKLLKNQIGVFNDPLEVILDSDYLTTLSKDEFLNGYAEVFKHSLLTDKNDLNFNSLIKLDFYKDVGYIIDKYSQILFKKLRRKGKTLDDVKRLLRGRDYFGSMMVENGDADCMLSGYSKSYPSVFIPIINSIGKSPDVEKVAATNLMITKQGPLFCSDTSLNINPSYKEIAKIAINTAKIVNMFGIKPVIAILSYSNFGSSNFDEAKKISKAVKILHDNNPELVVDGPIQSDFALNREMLKNRFPFSILNGKKVNTFIFPNLDSANITYKTIKELDNAVSVGPILIGLNQPIHILQLGASVDEIVNMSAIAVIDASQRNIKKK